MIQPKTLSLKIGLAILGGLSILSLFHIGATYFDNYSPHYSAANIFGRNEGAFYFLYAFLGFLAMSLFHLSTTKHLHQRIPKINFSKANYDNLAIILVGAVLILTSFIRFFVISEAPMTDDEHAYRFHAEILRNFKLSYADLPKPLRPFLINQFLVVGDQTYTQYYPGFPAVLAIGQWLNIENFVNPIIAAAGIYVLFMLASDMTGSKGIAFLTALLLSVSPAYLYTAALLGAYPLSLLLSELAILLIWKARQRTSLMYALLGAITIGMLLFTRPLSAFLIGIVSTILLFDGLIRSQKPVVVRYTAFATYIVLLAIIAGLFLSYNKLLTGSFFTTTYEAFRQFSPFYPPPSDTISIAYLLGGRWLELFAIPPIRLNFWTFGWPLSFILMYFAPKGITRTISLGIIMLYWFGHLPWYFVGVNLTGAAHYNDILPFLALLTATGLNHLCHRSKHQACASIAVSATLFSVLLSIGIFHPWVVTNLGQLADRNLEPYRLVQQSTSPAIIFAPSFLPKNRTTNTLTYFRKNNSPDLSNEILWFNDLGDKKNLIAMNLFPERNYYRLKHVTDSEGHFRYVLQPLHHPPNAPPHGWDNHGTAEADD